MHELPPLPSGIRLLTDPEGDRLRSLYPPTDLPPTPDDCITCGGKGTFLGYAPPEVDAEGDFTCEWKCNCPDQWTLHRYFLHANIGIAYQRLRWADATHVEPGALEKVEGYLNAAEAYIRAGMGLLLYGTNGTGKTLLSTLVLKELLGKGYDGYTTTFNEMLGSFSKGWKDVDDQRWFHKRVKNAQVLVIDDLGKEMKGRQEMPMATFDEVLRHRVANAKPTIITTNLDVQKVTETYGISVLSLLREKSSTYRFTGDDFRDNARNRFEDEVKAGIVRPVTIG